MEEGKKYRIFATILALLAFALDQWSKAEILSELSLLQHAAMGVTNFFNVVLVFNSGVSFGMFAGQNQPLILTIISGIIICILLVWLQKTHSRMVATGIGLVVGGAVGNVWDRVRYGAVVDFLDFHWEGLHWPAFNLADSFVFIGVCLLCIHSIFFDNKKPE